MKFQIERAPANEYGLIASVIQQVWKELPQKEWFVADDSDQIRKILQQEKGIAYKAIADGETAGVFIATFPGLGEENLGRDMGLAEEELSLVAHMDSVAIFQNYRGHQLQVRLMQAAEEELRQMGYRFLLCTVHPENRFSKANIEKQGYNVVKTTVKYGGYPRDILLKDLNIENNT